MGGDEFQFIAARRTGLSAFLDEMDYMIWNEIPTALGNLVGGLAFTGLTLYTTHMRTAPKRTPYQQPA